jgi:hypothetical protein
VGKSLSVVGCVMGVAALACPVGAVHGQTVLGPEWIEQGDAGSLPDTAQPVTATGSVTILRGALQGSPAIAGQPADFEDMYRVIIAVPTAFHVRTDPGSGGGADFNTQLWVFAVNGLGILGNDDAFDPGVGSNLFQFATDGSGAGILQPGEYLIAISGLLNRPTAGGLHIFNFATTTEISGPDGPGGEFPIDGWDTDPNCHFGDYVLSLQGIVGIPGPGALAVLVGGLFIGRTRRRGE